MFAGIKNVELWSGDWKLILDRAPSDFVFADAKPAKYDEADEVIESGLIHGVIVLDDFTPFEYWPESWRGKPDQVRDKWLNDERLVCTEVRTSEKSSALIARRLK